MGKIIKALKLKRAFGDVANIRAPVKNIEHCGAGNALFLGPTFL
tara:strand:- start:655 stop:786 length:132 start_codon:yes stop_codon:yes gene_type:complete